MSRVPAAVGRPYFPKFEHLFPPRDTAPGDGFERLSYVRSAIDRMPSFARDDDEWEGRRTYSLACRLTGLAWGRIFKALNDTRIYGALAAGAAWCRDMRPIDRRVVGFMYSAFGEAEPDLIKVGFTTKPEQRAKGLRREAGSRVTMIHTIPATMLDEWAFHCLGRSVAVKSEWYRRADLPSWILEPSDHERTAA